MTKPGDIARCHASLVLTLFFIDLGVSEDRQLDTPAWAKAGYRTLAEALEQHLLDAGRLEASKNR